MVIITHCFTATGVLLEYPFSEHHWLISLMGGATAIFVFISGYFYERVYRRRLTGRELIRQRLLLLLPPYLFISLVLIACDLEPGVRGTVPVAGDPVQGLAVLLLTGATGPAMWYVPFILALLLFTPAFARFAVAPVRRQLAVLAVLLAISIVVPRHPNMLVANLLHFALYYAYGIFWAVHRERLEAEVRRPTVLLLLALLLAAAATLQYAIGLAGDPGALGPLLSARDIVVVRKLILIALLLGLLLRFCRQPMAPLCALADLSFGLFFVHQPVMLGLVRAARVFGYRGEPWSSALLLWVLTVALSIAVLMLGRGLLGRRARVLLGA